MKVHNLLVTGSLTSGGENIGSISSSVVSTVTSLSSSVSTSIGQLSSSMASSMTSLSSSLTSSMGSLSSSMATSMNDLSSSMGSIMATTGSNLFKGDQTISGSIIPAVNGLYDLGSITNEFRDLYLSSASLYIDGTKVLGSTTQELQITTDAGQSFKILEAGSDTITLQAADGNITFATSGGGDVILDPTNGIIALKGTTTLYAGNRILSSDGNAIQIGNSVTMTGSLVVTGFIETQELRTTYISSSILYRSGSTKFGDELGDTHSFTGSLTVSGSISVPGSNLVSGSSQVISLLPSGTISGSVQILNGSGVFSGSAQVDVMSTTNIARLATTGSNTFSGIQTINTTTTENTVFNSPSNGGFITLKENGTIGGYLQWGLTLSGDTGGNYMLITSAENGGNIALQTRTTGGTYNNSALVINSSGNVGVNTPTPLEKLSVTGNLHVAGVGNNLYFDTDGSGRAISQYVSNLYEFNIVNGRGNSSRFILGNGSISLGTSGTAMFHINTTTGNIGIGTTSASNKLEIVGGNTTVGQLSVGNTDVTYSAGVNFLTSGTNRGFVGWRHTNSGSPFNLTGIHLFNTDNSNIVFGTNNTVKVVINVDGNLGIGTTTPPEPLSVSFAAHGLISQHRQSNGIGVGQNFYMKFNNAAGSAVSYAGIYSDIQDNTTGAHNGRMILQVANAGSLLSAVTIANSGNVGISESPNSLARLNINGFTKINRSFYNWYQAGWQGNSTYWHMKTSMYGGATGNTMYTMSLFKGYMYSYEGSVREGSYGFHNWSNVIYNPAATGNLFTTVYNSSDGYVVLVIPSGSGETGVTIDWHQAFGYPFVTAQVTAAGLHGSTTGKY